MVSSSACILQTDKSHLAAAWVMLSHVAAVVSRCIGRSTLLAGFTETAEDRHMHLSHFPCKLCPCLHACVVPQSQSVEQPASLHDTASSYRQPAKVAYTPTDQAAAVRLQVQLAQAEYQLPRLTRLWSHLERQAGGQSKGMGEKQIEVDKRLLRNQIAALKRGLEEVRRHRASHRQRRFEVASFS